MKQFIRKLTQKAKSICNRVFGAVRQVKTTLANCTGDLSTNTLGAIILGVIVIGLMVLAINTIFPGVIQNLFATMSSKLNSYMGTSTTGGTAGTFTALPAA